MIGFAGIIIAIPPIMWDWPVWASVLLAFASCAFVGYLNGLIVVHTGLPSFIVTLGSLFMLRGLTLGVTRGITGRTQASGLHEHSAGDCDHAAVRRPGVENAHSLASELA
jgi:simple sugar transport system permease protein